MSRVGGPNEVAAMSVGITVDQATLDSSLAQSQQKIDAFHRKNAEGVVGPGIGPTGGDMLPGGKSGTGSAGPSIVGPGLDNFTQQADKAKEKLVEVEKSGKSAFSGIADSLKEQASPLRNLVIGLQQTSTALFGIVGIAAAAAAAIGLIGRAGREVGDIIFQTSKNIQQLEIAVQEMTFRAGRQLGVIQQRLDMRLAQAGIKPGQREELLAQQAFYSNQRTNAQAGQMQLQIEEDRGDYIPGDVADLFARSSFGLVGMAFSAAFGSRGGRRRDLARSRLSQAESGLKGVNDQIEGIIGGSMLQAGGAGVATDGGLGSAVRTMSATNSRTNRTTENQARSNYTERQLDAARRRD